MPGLPAQLPWRRFVCVLHTLGYRLQTAGRGSVRVFHNATCESRTISLREPHPADTLRSAILHSYVRRLMLTPDEFMEILKEC
jgi:hypothetical protein